MFCCLPVMILSCWQNILNIYWYYSEWYVSLTKCRQTSYHSSAYAMDMVLTSFFFCCCNETYFFIEIVQSIIIIHKQYWQNVCHWFFYDTRLKYEIDVIPILMYLLVIAFGLVWVLVCLYVRLGFIFACGASHIFFSFIFCFHS